MRSTAGRKESEVARNKRSWDVLLIGGASGTGKTSASYPVARRFEVGITEVDDLYIVLECLTTPEQQPLLHYWRTNPEALHLPAAKILELLIGVSRVLAPAIKAVIANHLETQTPIVLEGDYLLPEIMADAEEEKVSTTDRVRGVFLYEPDETVILQNFSMREPEAGEQAKRAHVSWLYGQWLREECQRLGLSALPSRPWDSLLDRIGEAVA
jgi:2-phosphoglycerate kinase